MWTMFAIVTFFIGFGLLIVYKRRLAMHRMLALGQGFQGIGQNPGQNYQNQGYNQQPNNAYANNPYNDPYQQNNYVQPAQNFYQPPVNQGFNNASKPREF